MKFKHSLFLSLALASTAFAQTKTLAYPGQAFGISDNAKYIVGQESNIPGATPAANQALIFTTADSVEKQLTGPGATAGASYSVDNNGNAVGATSLTGNPVWFQQGSQAAAWDASGAYTNLHSLVNTGTAPTTSAAYGIDDSSGWVVGAANNGAASRGNAALWKKSGTTYTYTNLHDPVVASFPGTLASSYAKAINANKTIAGHITNHVGVWTTTDGGASYSFTSLLGVARQAGTNMGSVTTAANGCSGILSDNGSIVGSANFGSLISAGLWNASTINGKAYTYTDLHAQIATAGITATGSEAFGINGGATTAVGYAKIGGVEHASLWDLTTNSFSDLNDTYSAQLSGEKFQYLTRAYDIADSGEIVGYGLGTDGKSYGFLINKFGTLYNIGIAETVVAIPEPTSSVLLGLAGMTFLVRRKRK